MSAVYQILDNFLVKTSGQKLSFDEALSDSKPNVKTLMLIHGWGMNSQVWEPIRAELEAHYHIVWVDLPGHGFNKHIKAESFENMVELVSNHTPENTHIIAWSLGGLVAQSLLHRIPERIKSMTLVASTLRFSQSKEGDWPHAMSHEVLQRFAQNLKQDTEKTLKGFIALQFIGVENAKQAQDQLINRLLYQSLVSNQNDTGLDTGLDTILDIASEESKQNTSLNKPFDSALKTCKKEGGVFQQEPKDAVSDAQAGSELGSGLHHNIPSEEALDVGLDILKHVDLRDQAQICPEHWIFGEYDRLIPKDVVNDLKSIRTDAEITLLKKTGHAPFITHSDSFLRHVTDFINAVD